MPRPVNFNLQLAHTNQCEARLKQANTAFDASITKLRQVCPHLQIAWSEIGARHTRVCKDCGIQEIQWPSAFTTLTAPGGTWYETSSDKSKVIRKGKHPVLLPMSITAAYSYRRGPHLDVTED